MSCSGICSGGLSAAVGYGGKRHIRCICYAHHGGLSACRLVYCMGCALYSVPGGWCNQPEAENCLSGKSEAADRTVRSLRLYHFFSEDPVGYRKLFSCHRYWSGCDPVRAVHYVRAGHYRTAVPGDPAGARRSDHTGCQYFFYGDLRAVRFLRTVPAAEKVQSTYGSGSIPVGNHRRYGNLLPDFGTAGGSLSRR